MTFAYLTDRSYEQAELRECTAEIREHLRKLLGSDSPKNRTDLVVRLSQAVNRIEKIADSLVPRN
jgi:hypothetical protein